ncbi:MAG: membrane protein insertase YidC [Ruminiclostridium sp.]|nr:membrane protein insertase YidC [Ruminiclostridium sp.]
MWPIYLLLQNFGWAILIFTIILKLATLPLTLKQQKNMAYSQLFAPRVKEIQRKYRDNREKQAEEMQKLQAEGYNPTGGCGPLVLTMLILFGMIDVVYKPMTHMEHIPTDQINHTVTVAIDTEYASIFLNEYNAKDKELIELYKNPSTQTQIFVSDANNLAKNEHEFREDEGFKSDYSAKDPTVITKADREKYGNFTEEQFADITGDKSRLSAETINRLKQVKTKYSNLQKELFALQTFKKYPQSFDESSLITDNVKQQMRNLDKNMNFFGLDLGQTPQWKLEPLLLIPVLSFIFSVIQTLLTQHLNRINNPETADAGGMGMKFMIYSMPIISLMIAFSVPAGVGMYWSISYAVGIVQSLLLQKFYNPAKLREKAEAEFKANRKKQQAVTTTAVVTDAETGKEKVVTKTENLSQKEINRRKLAEARKADALKYGEEYNEDDE